MVTMSVTPDSLLKGIGLAWCVFILYKMLFGTVKIVKTFCFGKNLREYGTWAIVTGGTDGIGKALAMELAKQKINLLLISRTASKLEAVAEEISKKHGVEVKVETIDMSDTTLDTYQMVFDKYGALDIGIIINNVGVALSHPDYLDACDDAEIWKMLHINIVPVTALTKVFLPNLIKKQTGLVVNVSSSSSTVKAPLLSVYSATKSYVQVLSECLMKEYAEKGIHFQSLNPLFIKTNLTGAIKESLSVPNAEKYARHAVATLGKTVVTSGYWCHSLMLAALEVAPQFVVDMNVNTPLQRGRARWYRKQDEKKE